MSGIEKCIEVVFSGRNAAHIEHWKTQSYAKHVALGEFYEKAPEVLDRLVEARQGVFGVVGKVQGESKDAAAQLKDDMLALTKLRAEACGNITALENIMDELLGLYMTTIFKLERLN